MKRILPIAALLALGSLAQGQFRALSSPGPLAIPHQAFENQCEKCHVPLKGTPNPVCLDCHTGLRERIATKATPHWRFDQEGKACTLCHSDHKGREHLLAPDPPAPFDHATSSFALLGKHAGLPCASCHTRGAGGPKWVGLATSCAGCHGAADPHRGSLGTRCEACHSPVSFKPATRSTADHKLAMIGRHATLGCEACHASGAHLAAALSCSACHAQPHGGETGHCEKCHTPQSFTNASHTHDFCTCILPGKHQTAPCLRCHAGFKFQPTPFQCSACHARDVKHEELGACSQCHSAVSWKIRAFDHNRPKVGFALTGRHLEVGCENCHTQKGAFRGAPTACAGCHAKQAHGDFGACTACHAPTGWKPATFSHGGTKFPLQGFHAKVACETCHAKLRTVSFTPGPNECTACHADPHDGQFGAPHASRIPGWLRLASTEPAPHAVSPRFGCRDCHAPTGWKPSTVDAIRHGAFGFPLAGTHATVPCARCHDQGRFVGTPAACSTCHLDAHRDRFGSNCERCHDPTAWSHHPAFDHAKDTGFSLTQAHAVPACLDCHASPTRASAFKAEGCAACHVTRHGMQFGADCASCHQPTRFSAVAPFDHAQTGFPLERKHQTLHCLECHDAQRGPRLDPDCRTCHGDAHHGRTQTDCGDCHRPDRWSLIRFDHDRTEFPLRGRHYATPCRECHVNDQFTGVRFECIACHRADRQRADALRVSHRIDSFDCSRCHKPFAW